MTRSRRATQPASKIMPKEFLINRQTKRLEVRTVDPAHSLEIELFAQTPCDMGLKKPTIYVRAQI